MKTSITLAVLLFITGCAQLMETSNKAADKIAEGISYYCENVEADMRAEFRDNINGRAAPHTITVTCQ